MLCNLCRHFTTAVLQLDSGLPARGHERGADGNYEFQHGSFDTIKTSAEAGCQFCRFFLLVYRWVANRHNLDALSTRSRMANETSLVRFRPNYHQTFAFRFAPAFTPGIEVEFCRPRCMSAPTMVERTHYSYRQQGRSPPTASDRIPTSALATTTPERSDSEETVSQVRSWLAQCENNHANCKRQKDVVLPTRVIDVGKFGDTHVKIFETHGRSGRYLTLSYCWGNCDSYRTTTSNFLAGINSIPVSALPKTLRDAVEYTRLLDFSYVWIDALCIIQDSKADWEREAGKMCTTYENSTLSLSLLDSRSSNDGFLAGRPLVEHLEVDGVAVDLGLRRRFSKGCTMAYSALETRAWALQERILAPTVLHFRADNVYWECSAGRASLDYAQIDLGLDPYDTFNGQASISYFRPKLRSMSTEIEIEPEHWYKLVELYSARRLSFEKDRAAAIYGLAMKFQRCRSDRYVAGTWSADIHAGLLWVTDSRSDDSNRNAALRPSWSWLTAKAPVHFIGYLSWSPKAEIEIVNIEQGLAFASDQTPHLRINGFFVEGLLKPVTATLESGEDFWNGSHCYLDTPGPQLQFRAHSPTQRAQTEFPHVYLLLVADYYERDRPSLDHYLIVKRVEREDALWQGWISEFDGRVEEDVPCFRRVGLARRFIKRREDQVLFPSDTESELPARRWDESGTEQSEGEGSDGKQSAGEKHTPPVLRKLILV